MSEEKQCRICHEGEQFGRLFSPCVCTGSMKYIHVDCLNQWRELSHNRSSYFECDQCQFKYRLERTKLGIFLLSENAPLISTIIILFISVHIISMITYQFIDFNLAHYMYKAARFTPFWRTYSILPNLFQSYFDFLFIGVIEIGMIGFAGYIHKEIIELRRDGTQEALQQFFLRNMVFFGVIQQTLWRISAAVGAAFAIHFLFNKTIVYLKKVSKYLGDKILDVNE